MGSGELVGFFGKGAAASLVSKLFLSIFAFFQIGRKNTYPFLTPSTCKSTHHTPEDSNILHNHAFLTKLPMGSHWNTRK